MKLQVHDIYMPSELLCIQHDCCKIKSMHVSTGLCNLLYVQAYVIEGVP